MKSEKRIGHAMENITKDNGKINKLLNMDCRPPENMAKLKKAVNKTKWFKKFSFEDITPSLVEEGYLKVEKKYGIKIGYISKASENSWSIMIKDKDNQWIYTVLCHTFFEGILKTILVLYGSIEKGMKFKLKDN
jgi:hypothetical protein